MQMSEVENRNSRHVNIQLLLDLSLSLEFMKRSMSFRKCLYLEGYKWGGWSMKKRVLIVLVVGILIMSACSSNEQLLLPEDELSGELVIALDGAYRQELPYNSLAP